MWRLSYTHETSVIIASSYENLLTEEFCVMGDSQKLQCWKILQKDNVIS